MSPVRLPRRDPVSRARRLGLRLGLAALVAVAVLLVAPGGPTLAADAQVVVLQPSDPLAWRFDPQTVSVSAGASVTWVNEGRVAMTVTSPDGLFDSDEIPPGGSYTTTFDTPGSFRYFCVDYPHMKGVVVVTRESPPATREPTPTIR